MSTEVWVVVGFAGQVHGVFTTEKRAKVAIEHLSRDGVGVDLEARHLILNKDYHND